MRSDVGDPFAVHPDFAPIAQPGAIFLTGSNHLSLASPECR
jgi:hypothetical protein